ncbi:hypothetical protein [Flavobacterium salmonis]|uniref:Uncharacterized protein n=1 Tax=Flavobacterium salmonis TaxID=2654844 RepID=A0A6V6YS65_9FLAO|nr:hypothetical protein [Flavobacterium salmonis]CAD0002310.1 hypothetical protein FLAT13_01046 [Flavobacterium salmonis]
MKNTRITFAIIISMLFFSCGNPKSEKTETVIVAPKTETSNLEKLEVESSRLRAGGSIKKVELKNGKAIIEYVKDYNEYKKLNPQSGLTELDLENYWNSSDAIEKALVDGSIKLMTKLDFLDQVEIILPNKGTVNSINVKKSELEKFIGADFGTIKNNLDEKFSKPYVYNDSGREKLFSKFGKKK